MRAWLLLLADYNMYNDSVYEEVSETNRNRILCLKKIISFHGVSKRPATSHAGFTGTIRAYFEASDDPAPHDGRAVAEALVLAFEDARTNKELGDPSEKLDVTVDEIIEKLGHDPVQVMPHPIKHTTTIPVTLTSVVFLVTGEDRHCDW